jgi:protein-S-isoprenylcysteine O-methyltransferase Ste14
MGWQSTWRTAFPANCDLRWLALGLIVYLFVLCYEEPTLLRQFGEEYERYRERVPRWIPKLSRKPPRDRI